MLNKKLFAGLIAASVISFGISAEAAVDKETLYQPALLQSLVAGYYDGFVTVKEFKKHGDIGIGTFQGVNGELVMLDGHVYQALWDGSVVEAANSETIPFGNTTFFDADITQQIKDVKTFTDMKAILNETVTKNGKNYFYMIKIPAHFKSITVRSELKQEPPYKTLNDALATDQREFTYEDINGTLVGLYCPDFIKGVNTPGWHLHFISEDKAKGGHMLSLSITEGKILYDQTAKFSMVLPEKNAPLKDEAKGFNQLELGIDRSSAIKKVEES